MVAEAQRQTGTRNPFYETMREVSPGDVVFSFVDTVIAAIGAAQSYCWESPKPAEFGTTGQYWENVGWKVRVQFTPLVHRVRPKDQMQVLLPVLPPRYAPLQPNGNGIQAPAVYNPALQQPAVVVGEIPEEGAKPIRCSLHWGDLGRDGHQIAVPPWCSRYFSSSPAASGPRHTWEYIQAQRSASEVPRLGIFSVGLNLRIGDGGFQRVLSGRGWGLSPRDMRLFAAAV